MQTGVKKYDGGGSHDSPLIIDGFREGLPVLRLKTDADPTDNLIELDKDLSPISDVVDFKKTNKLTKMTFKHRWARNVKRNAMNYPAMNETNSLDRFRGLLTGKPSLLIGAGPSLAKNINLLNDTDITKIAVMHALPYLEKRGIKPDFVVHVDPMHTDEEFINPEFCKDITLLAMTYIAPKVLRKWTGGISFFSTIPGGDRLTDRLDNMSTADVKITPMGCSMACAAEIVDLVMDSHTMIMVGNDLAYAKSGDTHVWDGLDYNTQEFAGVPTIEIDSKGGRGERFMTCHQFIMYRHSIQEFAQRRKLHPPYRRYINATEGGILMLPETMTLKKALKSVENTTYNVNAA